MSDLTSMVRAIVREEVQRAMADAKPARDGFVSVSDYAARHSISRSTVRAAIREGRLPAVRIGRSVRIAWDASIATPVRVSGHVATKRESRVLSVVDRFGRVGAR